CTYRVEVVVSGSNTPTSPVPDEASPVSSFITEKSAVKSPAATAGTDADDAGAPLLLGDLLLHPPSPNPSSTTAVVAAIVLSGELIVPPFPVRIRGKPVSLVESFSSRSSPSGAALGPVLGRSSATCSYGPRAVQRFCHRGSIPELAGDDLRGGGGHRQGTALQRRPPDLPAVSTAPRLICPMISAAPTPVWTFSNAVSLAPRLAPLNAPWSWSNARTRLRLPSRSRIRPPRDPNSPIVAVHLSNPRSLVCAPR